MATYISHSAAETEALGENWGRSAASGWIIGLCGDLGSGKTQLVKGLARGLDIPERVHSPTFALVNFYARGRLNLFHLDLYRLETQDQIRSAGLEEYLNAAGVTVIEWAERWFGRRPGCKALSRGTQSLAPSLSQPGLLRWVEIETLSDNERRFVYEDIGA